jgi:hypothetical protein
MFLQFFANIVLIAAFLGMSCGCLATHKRQDWLGRLPFLALGSMILALLTLQIYDHWSGLAIDVGNQVSPQQLFFGTEYRNPDLAKFAVPIEMIVGVFFILVALMFVGLGQVLGQALDVYPNRVVGYTLNICGSLAGIAVFSMMSFAHASPVVWFSIGVAGVAYLLHQREALTVSHVSALTALLVRLPASR